MCMANNDPNHDSGQIMKKCFITQNKVCDLNQLVYYSKIQGGW